MTIHSAGIVSPKWFLIGNQELGFLAVGHPTGTHIRFNRVLLPNFCPAIPLVSSFMYKYIKTTPGTPAFAHLTLTGMLRKTRATNSATAEIGRTSPMGNLPILDQRSTSRLLLPGVGESGQVNVPQCSIVPLPIALWLA